VGKNNGGIYASESIYYLTKVFVQGIIIRHLNSPPIYLKAKNCFVQMQKYLFEVEGIVLTSLYGILAGSISYAY
jgi:hypothetical protein